MVKRLKAYLAGLKHYYRQPLAQTFRQFRNGAIYFAFGLVLIYLANTQLPPSLKQDLVTLCGLVFVVIGFTMAMLAHIRMIIARILRFFTSK